MNSYAAMKPCRLPVAGRSFLPSTSGGSRVTARAFCFSNSRPGRVMASLKLGKNRFLSHKP